jgi:HSP90 family molecular chaperone
MSKRILEVNGRSPVIRHLAELHHRDPDDTLVALVVHQLLDNAMLLEGLAVSPDEMVPRIHQMLEQVTATRAAAEAKEAGDQE